jgi:predicted ATPase
LGAFQRILMDTDGAGVPYLLGVKVLADRLPSEPAYPFDLPFLTELDLTIREPVAFFCRRERNGKSTVEQTADYQIAIGILEQPGS